MLGWAKRISAREWTRKDKKYYKKYSNFGGIWSVSDQRCSRTFQIRKKKWTVENLNLQFAHLGFWFSKEIFFRIFEVSDCSISNWSIFLIYWPKFFRFFKFLACVIPTIAIPIFIKQISDVVDDGIQILILLLLLF